MCRECRHDKAHTKLCSGIKNIFSSFFLFLFWFGLVWLYVKNLNKKLDTRENVTPFHVVNIFQQ